MSTTHIGNQRCTRCGGGSAPCPVCRPEPEMPTRRKRVITDEEIQIEMALYRHAIASQYRFYSYGDAMVLARQAAAA